MSNSEEIKFILNCIYLKVVENERRLTNIENIMTSIEYKVGRLEYKLKKLTERINE